MKVKVKEGKKLGFKPVKVTITIESLEDLLDLFARSNMNDNAVVHYLPFEFHEYKELLEQQFSSDALYNELKALLIEKTR